MAAETERARKSLARGGWQILDAKMKKAAIKLPQRKAQHYLNPKVPQMLVAVKKKLSGGALRKGGRESNCALAPEEVGGKAEEEEGDGNGKKFELRGVEEGKNDGVADDGGGYEDEDERGPGISGDAIG
jgi:hypothetical protein